MADETAAPQIETAPAPDAATQPIEPAPLLAPGSNADGSQEGEPADWLPPQTDEQGFAIDGDGLPLNIRRRAFVLHEKGMDADPAGAVAPEGIQAAADELAAYDAAYPSLSGMKKAALVDQAGTEGVALPEDATADQISQAILAARPARY